MLIQNSNKINIELDAKDANGSKAFDLAPPGVQKKITKMLGNNSCFRKMLGSNPSFKGKH